MRFKPLLKLELIFPRYLGQMESKARAHETRRSSNPQQLSSFAPGMQAPQVVTAMTTSAVVTAPPALDWNYPAFKHMQICAYTCSTSPRTLVFFASPHAPFPV
jgi:hypothetical protein